MGLNVAPTILQSSDCFNCRKCCKFDPDEVIDAPMFTPEQYLRAIAEFDIEGLRFEQRGALYQVMLLDIPGSEKKICPFYDEVTTHCRIYAYEIFDCRTWPFYLMHKDGKVVMTLSQDCPIVNRQSIPHLTEYARKFIGPKMADMARQFPDFVTEYNGTAVVLFEVSDL